MNDKKRHLTPPGIVLEKHKVIGFARQPVIEKNPTVTSVAAESTYHLYRRPWIDCQK